MRNFLKCFSLGLLIPFSFVCGLASFGAQLTAQSMPDEKMVQPPPKTGDGRDVVRPQMDKDYKGIIVDPSVTRDPETPLPGNPDKKASSKTNLGGGSFSEMLIQPEALTFAPGQFHLSEGDRVKILSKIESAKSGGWDIKKVRVVAWSDKPALAEKDGEMAEADRRLAAARGDEVKSFLTRALRELDVTVINMAESANVVARMFSIGEKELKSAFSKRGGAGVPNEMNEEISAVTGNGGPSKVVILMIEQPKKTPGPGWMDNRREKGVDGVVPRP